MFGGSDPSLYMGSLYSTPIIKEWYYETVIVDIEVDHVSLKMDCKEVRFLIILSYEPVKFRYIMPPHRYTS